MAKKHVLIDVRPLLTKNISGVTVYIENILEAFSKDKTNKYSLFCNSAKGEKLKLPLDLVFKKYPNKLLNLSLSKFKIPKIDKLIDEKVDIFISPDLRPSALSKSVKKIQVLHDFSWEKYPQFFSKKTKLWFKLINPYRELKESDVVVTVSKSIQKELQEKHPKINSINIPPFLKISKSTSKKKDYFFYIGTLEPRKNIEQMLNAFEILQKKYPKVKLYIAGEKNPQIFSRISLKNLKGIKLLGRISEKQKVKYLQEARALIYISEYEGFGLPVAEAILSGTPCLISKDPTLKETAGKAALKCNPHNLKDISKKMEMLLCDKKLYADLQAACKKEAKKWQNKETLKQWLNLFKNL